jgi:L-threonylcarbamoyladenylate synthase
VSKQQIEQLIGAVQLFTGLVDPSVAASSPGQHAVHYSPRATTYRFDAHDLHRIHAHRNHYHQAVILTIAPQPGDLQMPGNPADYARVLYATLRDLDARHVPIIFVQMPPDDPEWVPIRDRLIRATQALPADLK